MAILGVAHATPYRPGEPSHAAGAPAALRAASLRYVPDPSRHDFDLGGPLDALTTPAPRIADCGDVATDPNDDSGNRARITAAVRAILHAGAVPLILGGDDSVPIPVLQAYEGQQPLFIVHVDAHIDWRDAVNGVRHGYSSSMRRASEMAWVGGMVQIGVRGVGSAGATEVRDARAWGSRIVTAREIHRHGIDRIIDLVPSGAACFVSIDLDGLDPAVMPAVLSPAPGGLAYNDVLDLLHGVAGKARIVGCDIVEFAPEHDSHGLGALAASRIACNAIGAILRSRSAGGGAGA